MYHSGKSNSALAEARVNAEVTPCYIGAIDI